MGVMCIHIGLTRWHSIYGPGVPKGKREGPGKTKRCDAKDPALASRYALFFYPQRPMATRERIKKNRAGLLVRGGASPRMRAELGFFVGGGANPAIICNDRSFYPQKQTLNMGKAGAS
jgi:hypothetical protein